MYFEWFHSVLANSPAVTPKITMAAERLFGAFIDKYTLLVFYIQRVGAKSVDGEGIGVEHQVAINHFPRCPRVRLCLNK